MVSDLSNVLLVFISVSIFPFSKGGYLFHFYLKMCLYVRVVLIPPQLTSKLLLKNTDRSFFTHRLCTSASICAKDFSITELINKHRLEICRSFSIVKRIKKKAIPKHLIFFSQTAKKIERECVLLHAHECFVFLTLNLYFSIWCPVSAGLCGDMCCVHTL